MALYLTDVNFKIRSIKKAFNHKATIVFLILLYSMKYLTIIIALLAFTACSLDKVYLQPNPIPVSAKSMTLNHKTDSTVITFSGSNYKPVFLKNGIDTIHFDFTIESVIFESENGNKINGWFLKSKNQTAHTTLLHFHGNAGNLISQIDLIKPLLEYGFQIFMFDYSGFGFSEGKATRNNVIVDAYSALDYIKDRTDVEPTKLIIYGQSLGGHLSAVVASRRQNEIDGLVIEGAFSSHKDIAEHSAGFLGKTFVAEKYSAVESIKKFNKPLLVLHSKEDQIIPFEMGQKLFNNANAPKQFIEIKGRHLYGPIHNAKGISEKIKSMIQ